MLRAPLRDTNATRDVNDDARASGMKQTILMTNGDARSEARRRVSFKNVGDEGVHAKVTVVGACDVMFLCVSLCVCVCETRVLVLTCACVMGDRDDAVGAVTRSASGGGGGGGSRGETGGDVCASREPTRTITNETRHWASGERSTVYDQGVYSRDYEAEEFERYGCVEWFGVWGWGVRGAIRAGERRAHRRGGG